MKIISRAAVTVFTAMLVCIFAWLLLPVAQVSADESEFKCWAVFVGISKYQNIDASSGCAEGATTFHEAISPIWGEEQCRLLTDEDATKSNIKEAIGWLADNAGENDTVLFYYAGHGTNGGYLSTYRSMFMDSWISTTELRLWLKDINSTTMTVILDSCLSGRFSLPLSLEGRVILTSSSNNEVSYVIPGIGGIFTVCLLEVIDDFIYDGRINDPSLTAEELFELAEPETIERTTYYTDTIQHPIMSDEYDGELNLLIHCALKTDPSMSYTKDIFTVDGEAYARYDVLTWAPGSVHNMEILTLIDTGEGIKYIFSSWEDGDTSPVRIIAAEGKYMACFDTQYQLSIISEHGKPEGHGWYDEDGIATISIESVDKPTEKHHFAGWSGDYSGEEKTAQVTMDAPKTINVDWQSEYLLNIDSDFGEPEGTGWYDKGTTAAISVESVEGPDARHYFTGWSGDYSGEEKTAQVTMDAPKSITANWHSEYLLNIESVWGEPTGGGWYDEGDIAEVSIESIEEPDARHHFTGWSGDYSGDENTAQLTIDAPKSITANWYSEYLLIIESHYGETTGEGWYDEDSTVTVSVPKSNGVIVRQVFDGWSGDFQGTSATSEIKIDKAMSITAEWRTDFVQLYILIGVLVIIAIITYFIFRRRRRSTEI